jgi:transposase InsO family protein
MPYERSAVTNGLEFRNSHFETFCHDLGLEHQFLSPYTPPQNGVVKRKNRTLCEMARTMLDEHRTPRRFWAEAVNTTCYISEQDLPQSAQEENMLRVDARSHTQGDSLPCLRLQMLYP